MINSILGKHTILTHVYSFTINSLINLLPLNIDLGLFTLLFKLKIVQLLVKLKNTLKRKTRLLSPELRMIQIYKIIS